MINVVTDCNPMNVTCPNDPAFGLKDHYFNFNTSRTLTDSFNITNGVINYGTNGAEFTISKRLDSPTIRSKFFIFFGKVTVMMRAASGQGIISSVVLESDDLDEIDWEMMGGFPLIAQSNYFGKGNTTSFDRAVYHNATTDVHANFHNYTTDWTSEKIDFYIDGLKVRTLMYEDANGGYNFPQTPCTLRMGNWAGGDSGQSNGTIEWAGGLTDYTEGPFTMYVKSAYVTDYGSGKEYEWTDKSGAFTSIKSIAGNSTTATTIANTLKEENTAAPLTMAEKFDNLSEGKKIAIYASGGTAAALLIFAALFACIRQRRSGRRERDAYNAKVEKEQNEAYENQMELREKGLGGFDKNSRLGDDALGGWGGSYADAPAGGVVPPISTNVFENTASGNSTSKANSAASTVPLMSPESPRGWQVGDRGGLIANAQNAYSGGYNQVPNANNYLRSSSYNSAAPSASFPTQGGQPQGPSQESGSSNGGYSRF
ncbi:concanavalin A-like lectin/glucanase domain-containing protein [Calycina marina]|uniref:chitinase n=1 Tax=Calycina marina TaxID=1763456 RepID=A0A9P8CEC6_9HELO|nr:concanavalin A-like lectin/glucanase domain-containing protein [Calycina marina]